MSEFAGRIKTPIGEMHVRVDDAGAVTQCSFRAIHDAAPEDRTRCATVLTQLDEYFAGTRTRFELPLAPKGTEFQQEVWRVLVSIPYGETTTYLSIAEEIGRPRAVRAVGGANGANPIAVIVPCHRVIGTSGKLVGYGGGVKAKEMLLRLERAGVAETLFPLA